MHTWHSSEISYVSPDDSASQIMSPVGISSPQSWLGQSQDQVWYSGDSSWNDQTYVSNSSWENETWISWDNDEQEVWYDAVDGLYYDSSWNPVYYGEEWYDAQEWDDSWN